MGDIFSDSDSSESFIPSSNFEPPPPVDCILQKSRTSQDQAEFHTNEHLVAGGSHVYTTQPDEFEDIHMPSSNQMGDIASPNTFSSEEPLVEPHSLLRANSESDGRNPASSLSRVTSSRVLMEKHGNIDPKRSGQLEKLLSPALGSRASVPTSIPSKTAKIPDFRSQVNTGFNSVESLNSLPSGAATNTTSSHTPRSGSDLFKSDSSVFREPLVPPRRQNVASTSTNTTNDELDSSPVFLYTLSLSVQRLPSQIEKSDDVEFKAPIFAKTLNWQSFRPWRCASPSPKSFPISLFRVQRTEESAAAFISDAAGVLADSFGDWVREYLPSDSEAYHSDYSHTPATLIAAKVGAPNTRISSLSTECFASRKFIPESTIESSDLDAQSDTVSKPMEQSSNPKLVAPEGEAVGISGNRTSTSSSEYFLPRKPTANKRKLGRGSMDTRGSVMGETETQPDGATNFLPPESELQDASQNRTSTSSSEYFIPVKKSAMRIAKVANCEAIDAAEVDAQPMSLDKTLEQSTSTSETGIRSVNGFWNWRSTKKVSDIGQQEILESSSESGLQTAGISNTTGSQEKSLQVTKTAKNAEETTIQEAEAQLCCFLNSPIKRASNFDEDSSDASTVACKLEPESPVAKMEPFPSPSKSESNEATSGASARTKSRRTKKAFAEDTPQLHEPAIQLENSTVPAEFRDASVEQLHQVKKGRGQPLLTPVVKVPSPSESTASTAPTDSPWKLGMYVYAKWGRRRYFYAGQVAKRLRDGRYQIIFEDKTTATVAGHNVILTEFLPLGSRVEVDINGTGDFAGDYVVSGHAVGTTPPSYIVKRFVDDDVNQIPRPRVAIHTEKLKELLFKGQVSSITKRVGNFSAEISGQAGDISTPLSALSKCSDHRIPSSEVATPEVPAEIMISSLLRRKRSLTDLNEMTERGSVKIAGQRRTTTRKVSKVTPSTPSSKKRGRRRSRKSSSGRFNRRDSQILQAGRRIVTRASRTSRLLERNQVSSSSVSQSASSHLAPCSGKRRKVTTKATSVSEASLMAAPPSPPIIKSKFLRRLSITRFSTDFTGDSSMNHLDSETFEQMCRRYDLPIPQSDLFSHWAFVFTTGVKSAHSDNFRLNSNDSTARNQLDDLSENTFFLRKLVGSSGGRDIGELSMDISSTGYFEDGRRIVLIAPSARRTVRYLQALATLGRVPLVHPVWILDSCLLAAGKRPIVTPPKVVTEIVSMKIKPSDLPLFLLHLAPRGLYELPRGVNMITNQLVPPTIFPPTFTEPIAMPSPKTLLELGGYTSSKVVAIVTNDSAKFGVGWLSILRHALLTETGTELPSILSPEESLSRLQAIKMSKVTPIFGRGLKIVLADQDRIPEPTIAEIRNMGFMVVNKEFLIQSLINGKMLDFKYGTAWRS